VEHLLRVVLEESLTQFSTHCPSNSPHCCVYSGHIDSVICLEGTEGRIISGSVDGTIRLWSAHRPMCEAVLEGHTDWVRCLHARGSTVVSGSDDGTIRFWDLERAACVKVLQTHSVNCLQLFADVVFYGSEDGVVFVIDCESGGELAQLRGHTQSVNCMAVWDEGDALVTGSGDTSVRIWSLTNHQCLHELRHHAFSVNCLTIHASVLYTGSGDCTLQGVMLSDLPQPSSVDHSGALTSLTNMPRVLFSGHSSPVFCLHVCTTRQDLLCSGAGVLLCSGAGDCGVRVWNTATGDCLLHIPGSPGITDIMHATGHMDWVNAIWAGGDVVFSGSVDKTIRRWHLPSLLGTKWSHSPSGLQASSPYSPATGPNGTGQHSSTASICDFLAWGHNLDGALGLGTTDAAYKPQPIFALQGLVVSIFACGGGSEEQHSAAVTSNGALYTWGSGRSGQLGHGDLENLVQQIQTHTDTHRHTHTHKHTHTHTHTHTHACTHTHTHTYTHRCCLGWCAHPFCKRSQWCRWHAGRHTRWP
jgi:WD40 repeat protein